MESIAEFLEHLQHDVVGASEFRAREAEEHPDDTRHAESAASLAILAAALSNCEPVAFTPVYARYVNGTDDECHEFQRLLSRRICRNGIDWDEHEAVLVFAAELRRIWDDDVTH